MASLHHLFRASSPEQAEVPLPDTPPSLIDLNQPDFTPEIMPGHVAPVYFIQQPGADIHRVAILAQGWTGKVTSLMNMGHFMVDDDPSLAVVFADQPRINIPHDHRLLRPYLNALSQSNLGELRFRTVLTAAELACQYYKLDSIDEMDGHSLGGVDVVRAADRLMEDGKYGVGRVELIATAGLQKGIENIRTIGNLKKAAECSRTNPRKFDAPNLPQLGLEGLYALNHDVSNTIIDLRAQGVPVKLIDMARDMMFSRRRRPDCIGDTDYMIIDVGLACHCLPSHLSEIPILLETKRRMREPVYTRPALLSLAA